MSRPKKINHNDLIGKVLNGWEIIDRIPFGDDEVISPSGRINSARFLVRPDGSDIEPFVRTYGGIRARSPKRLSEHKNFVDRSGEVYNGWKIHRLAEDYFVVYSSSKSSKDRHAEWVATSIHTGVEVVGSIKRLRRLSALRHGV